MTDFHQLVDLVHPGAAHNHHHHNGNGLVDSLDMSLVDNGQRGSPGSGILYPVATPPRRIVHPLGLGGVLTGTSSVTRTSPVAVGITTTASSSPVFGEDSGSLYGGRGGSDGGEPVFSVNDFGETYMGGQEEETRSSAEYPDDVYTSSDDEDYGDEPMFKVCVCVFLLRKTAYRTNTRYWV